MPATDRRVARHYPLLTPSDRASLVLQTLGREDRVDLDRLNGSCPRRTYVAPDDAYVRRLKAMSEFA